MHQPLSAPRPLRLELVTARSAEIRGQRTRNIAAAKGAPSLQKIFPRNAFKPERGERADM